MVEIKVDTIDNRSSHREFGEHWALDSLGSTTGNVDQDKMSAMFA